jgi:hypothetical protein
MKKLLVLVIALAAALSAQEGAVVNPTIGPPPVAYTELNYYSGANQIYQCRARSTQQPYTASVLAGTMTNIVVLTNVGTVTWVNHGLAVNNRITVAGTVVDTDLNTSYNVVGVTSADVFTITTASVGNATYTTGLTITTTAPRNTAAIWSVQASTYSGANLAAVQWAGGNPAMTNICANRATLSYQ